MLPLKARNEKKSRKNPLLGKSTGVTGPLCQHGDPRKVRDREEPDSISVGERYKEGKLEKSTRADLHLEERYYRQCLQGRSHLKVILQIKRERVAWGSKQWTRESRILNRGKKKAKNRHPSN